MPLLARVVCQVTMPSQWARTMRTNFLIGSSRERIARGTSA